MRPNTTSRIALATVAVVALSTFAFDMAADSVAFGGFGFGTRYAQAITWLSFGIGRTITGHEPPFVLWRFFELLINTFVYALIVAVVHRLSRGRLAPVLATFVIYMGVLFVYPQATFGP